MRNVDVHSQTTLSMYRTSLVLRLGTWLLITTAVGVCATSAAESNFQRAVIALLFLVYLNSHACTQISPRDAEDEFAAGKLNEFDMRQAVIESGCEMSLKFITTAYLVIIAIVETRAIFAA